MFSSFFRYTHRKCASGTIFHLLQLQNERRRPFILLARKSVGRSSCPYEWTVVCFYVGKVTKILTKQCACDKMTAMETMKIAKGEPYMLHRIRKVFLKVIAVMAFLLITVCPLTAKRTEAAKYAVVYKGVDYSKVYNYSYFVKKYPTIKEKYNGDDEQILAYFVTVGMKKQMQGSANFDVKSYRYGNPDLRRKYVYNYKKYYLHYMNTGYKSVTRTKRTTGITKMQNPVTTYNGKDYSNVYDYFYYCSQNKDVVAVIGDDDYLILEHFVKHGKAEGRKAKAGVTPKVTKAYDDGTFKAEITSCKITNSGTKVTVTATGTGTIGTRIGLFPLASYTSSIKKGASASASATSKTILSFSINLNKGNSSSVLQDKFVIAAQKSDGSWRICSNYFYIQNPNACASRTTAFPTSARGTKKGLKMSMTSDAQVTQAVNLRLSHVVVDFPIETFLDGSDLRYQYEGKSYYFSSAITDYKSRLTKLKKAGIVVTGVFYLSASGMTNYMMPSAAGADKSSSLIFGINTKNSNRKRLEALFSCLADYWTKDGILVANWVFGNESNNYQAYNFCGNRSYSQYIVDYCEQFRLFNTAVKSVWSNARTYMSYDHNWNLSFNLSGSYNVRKMLISVNSCFESHGSIHWDIALHPYPSPEQDARFWNRSSYVENTTVTQQYTMLNIAKIAAYIKSKYGSSIHIILPETGFSSVYRGQNMEKYQAAAVAYAYYKAEFNSNIDMIAIHRDLNDPSETAGGWYMGIYRNSFSSPKPAADVFKYMDTPSWKTHTAAYLKYIGDYTSWGQLVSGFKSSRFTKS